MKKPEGKLQELVTRLQRACGEQLASVVVYGSAAREDFHETFSDVNSLILLRQLLPHPSRRFPTCCAGGVATKS